MLAARRRKALGAHGEGEGRDISWLPPAYSSLTLQFMYIEFFRCATICSIWVSPLFAPLAVPGGDSVGDSVTRFKRDLLEYLSVYHHRRVAEWADIIRRHDLSPAR